MPKVSVIIPVYNVENYLRECLDSVVNQTLKDIEIICVNDGSTDNSLEILEEYAAKDERVRIFTQKNSGAAVARNLGIKNAGGKYLSILDSDDYFELDMLEKLYNRCEKYNLDCAICRCCILDDANKKIINADFSIRKDWLPAKDVFNYKDMPRHVFGFCVGWSWDKLYRKEFVMKHKLQFQNLRSTNDMLFVFLSLVLAEKIAVVEDVLITHRQNRPGQLSETREKDPLCFIDAVYELKRELESKGLFQEVQQSFDNWALMFCFWHLDTLRKKEALILKNKLYKEVFKELRFYKHSVDYFYDKNYYIRLLDIHGVSLLQNFFSIRNENDHKVIRVLGLKMKIKRKIKIPRNTSL